jgi:redox-sensitive bicupin YhaK (pirin superfamily)
MITIRKAEDRGRADLGWLDSKHSFSFGQYQDPAHMGFESLRVINDDHVAPGGGFDSHPHENMEIISYVLEGSLEHKDSMGNGSVIKPGDVQRLSAGTGVTHSEFNHSKEKGVHFLQIWILPSANGLEPGYEQKNFSADEKKAKLKLVASNDGRDGSVSLNQDVDMYITILDEGDSVTHSLNDNRKAWVQVAKGSVSLNGQELRPGDGAAIDGENIELSGGSEAEVVIFDLAVYKPE